MKTSYDEIIKELLVEDGDRFIKAKGKISYGLRRKLESLRSPKKIRVRQGSDEIMMETEDYDYKKDPDLQMLAKQIKEWSKDEKVSLRNIIDDEELGDLFDETVSELRRLNNMQLKNEEEEKND